MNVLDLSRHGFTVIDTDDDDPVLVSPDGTPVDTWREGYPYAERMTRDQYELEKRPLQIELLNSKNGSNPPAAGEITMYDRSWYNRSGGERVMGFCTDDQYHSFLSQAPAFEQVLTNDGVDVVIFWFSVSRTEQLTRFAIRQVDPARHNGHGLGALDGGQEQRQEAGQGGSHAPRPAHVRLRGRH